MRQVRLKRGGSLLAVHAASARRVALRHARTASARAVVQHAQMLELFLIGAVNHTPHMATIGSSPRIRLPFNKTQLPLLLMSKYFDWKHDWKFWL